MKKAGSIKENLQRILGIYDRDIITLFVAEVTAVDETARTCNVKVIHGNADIEIEDVSLSAVPNDGLVLLPEVGSTVMVGVTTQQTAFILLTSNLQKFSLIIDKAQILMTPALITLMDGSFDGLVKVNDLVTKLGNLESDLNTLKAAFTAWVVVPNDGGAALKTITTTWAGNTLTPTVVADLENQYIKHGVPQ